MQATPAPLLSEGAVTHNRPDRRDSVPRSSEPAYPTAHRPPRDCPLPTADCPLLSHHINRVDIHDNLHAVGRRDAVDRRLVQDVRAGTGKIIQAATEVGGWPELRSGTAPVDSDRDGMPDAWETARGLDPNLPGDRNGTSLSGSYYTNLEVYLNGLVENRGMK